MSTLSNSAFFRFPHTSTPNINMNIKNCLLKISCKSSCMNPPPLSSSHQLSSTSQKKCDWNMFQKMVAAILGMVEGRIDVVGKKEALPKTIDPKVQLAGNFAPVPETEATSGPLELEGHLPHALEGGVYIRNGANPAMMEPRAGHHLFDGDGMLHAVRFHKGGIATYCCRYTRTYRLQMEQALGRTLFPKAIGELHGHSGLARLLLFYTRSLFGLVEPDEGMGTANAGVVFFNGHLLAMSEDDLPYALKITHSGELQTLGRYNFDGQLTASSMIAHPKIDARTGEMFALSYDVIKPPYLRYFKFSPHGVKGPDVSISLSEPTMVHDFAITQNYVVIPDQQVVFRLHRIISGGSPVVMDSQKMPRFGILPRDDTDESRLKWIDVPDCFCFHLWNAWEDGDDVVIIGSHMTPPDSIFNEPDLPFQSLLSEIRLNTKTGASTRRRLVMNLNLEAGQVNRNWLGRKTRYAYMAIVEPWPKVSGIAKVDLIPHHHGSNTKDDNDNNVVAKFMYEPGCYGGEPFFVPRSSNPEVEAAEDEGYVLTFVHNEESGESRLLILDAASALKPLASVKLPSRVPYGFHGTFVTAKELAHQPQ